MSTEIILKKLEQIQELIGELESLLNRPFLDFQSNRTISRAAERDLQLIIDIASDINTHILIERGSHVPDTYKQSFSDLIKEGVLVPGLGEKLTLGARVRNILVHEYDLEEDLQKFYLAAKDLLPHFKEYVETLVAYTSHK